METICRLVRVLQCPHECGHALLISQGSPGMSTNLAQLAAHLCGYSVFRINSSALSASDRYTLDSFKGDLVSAYTRAGVKVTDSLFLSLSPSISSVYFPIVSTFSSRRLTRIEKYRLLLPLKPGLRKFNSYAKPLTIQFRELLQQHVKRS